MTPFARELCETLQALTIDGDDDGCHVDALLLQELFSEMPESALEAILRGGCFTQALSSGHAAAIVQHLIDTLGPADHDQDIELQKQLWTLLPQFLLQVGRHASAQAIVQQTTLMNVVLRVLTPQDCGITSPHDCVIAQALECVVVLQQHEVTWVFDSKQQQCAVVHAVAGSLFNASTVSDVHVVKLVLQALGGFSAESTTREEEIAELTAAHLTSMTKKQKLLILRSVLELRSGRSSLRFLSRKRASPWNVRDHLTAAIKLLRHGVAFERLVVMDALLPSLQAKTGEANRFLQGGGITILLAFTLMKRGPVFEKARVLLSTIAKSDEQYLGRLIATQLRHPSVQILPFEFCENDFQTLNRFNFPECIHHLKSHRESEVQHALDKLLPGNKHILAALCLDHELIAVLLTLVSEASCVGDATKNAVWSLLRELSYELPTVGSYAQPTISITAWLDNQQQEQLTSHALQMLRAKDNNSLVRRQQAALILVSPFLTTVAARAALINDQDGIPELVNCLAYEDDEALAETLCDAVRGLVAENPIYSVQIDLFIQSLLGSISEDDSTQSSSLRFQNLLSVYRKPKQVVLGLAGEYAFSNLQRNIELLFSGNLVEKRLVLQLLNSRAASWSQSHWNVLAQHLLEVVRDALCKTTELKQLTIQLLRVIAAVDDGCREKLRIAQRVYHASDPAFFAELMDSDSVARGSGNENKEDGWADDNEDQGSDYEMEESWVTVDYPTNLKTASQ